MKNFPIAIAGLEKYYKSRISQRIPVLRMIAEQNALRLSNPRELKIADTILQRSIFLN